MTRLISRPRVNHLRALAAGTIGQSRNVKPIGGGNPLLARLLARTAHATKGVKQ